MPTALDIDLEKIQAHAFDRADWAEPVIRQYHAVTAKLDALTVKTIRALYDWIFVPTTLWPFNLQDVLMDCLATLAQGKKLSAQHQLIIELLPEPPDAAICTAVTKHEFKVQKGIYENLVKTQAKYDQTEIAMLNDPEWSRQWACIKAAFDLSAYRDYKGVIRRTMTAERNLRPSFSVDLRQPEDAFHAAFDAFCLRWNLYGMQHDKPLLLKLAVNLTPYGTLIHIPAYWSFDPKRDIQWAALAELHRIRVPGRQGPTVAKNAADRRLAAAKLSQLDQEARRLGLKGEPKHEFLCRGLGLVDGTSPKRLSRLRAEFKNQALK